VHTEKERRTAQIGSRIEGGMGLDLVSWRDVSKIGNLLFLTPRFSQKNASFWPSRFHENRALSDPVRRQKKCSISSRQTSPKVAKVGCREGCRTRVRRAVRQLSGSGLAGCQTCCRTTLPAARGNRLGGGIPPKPRGSRRGESGLPRAGPEGSWEAVRRAVPRASEPSNSFVDDLARKCPEGKAAGFPR